MRRSIAPSSWVRLLLFVDPSHSLRKGAFNLQHHAARATFIDVALRSLTIVFSIQTSSVVPTRMTTKSSREASSSLPAFMAVASSLVGTALPWVHLCCLNTQHCFSIPGIKRLSEFLAFFRDGVMSREGGRHPPFPLRGLLLLVNRA